MPGAWLESIPDRASLGIGSGCFLRGRNRLILTVG
ncbi:MAG: hypothetical protein ACI957_003889 [Verrucomicrobiales bacterium]